MELSVAINDVKWVLSELVAILSIASMDTGKKHPREEAIQEPALKRYV